jgi:hypothetical protein
MSTKTISLKRQLIGAASLLSIFDKPIQIIKWCRFVENCRCPIFETRQHLYNYIEGSILSGSPIDYLEFGVAEGASLISWLELDRNQDSRFWGFDSFEGLPETWRKGRPKGTFSRGGKPPQILDSRLDFVVGLFQDTLAPFLQKAVLKHRLVIHNDSDLYSATLYTLSQLNSIAQQGTIIIFDEFWDARHEFRALMDYSAAYGRKFKTIAATKRFAQAAIVLE